MSDRKKIGPIGLLTILTILLNLSKSSYSALGLRDSTALGYTNDSQCL